MTCYLTDSLDPNELERGFNEGVFTAAKLYPAMQPLTPATALRQLTHHAGTLSAWKIGMPPLVHGEVTHADIDIFDREARFIESVMELLRQRLTALKVVLSISPPKTLPTMSVTEMNGWLPPSLRSI